MSVESREAPRKILVVEDEPSIRELLAVFLESTGYDVRTASTGTEAAAIALQDRFDAVISDIKMPGKSGIELHALIKEKAPDLAARMLLLTGDTMTPETARFLDESGCAWMTKPFDLTEILAKIRCLTVDDV